MRAMHLLWNADSSEDFSVQNSADNLFLSPRSFTCVGFAVLTKVNNKRGNSCKNILGIFIPMYKWTYMHYLYNFYIF